MTAPDERAKESRATAAARPALDPAWYDAIAVRRSRRRYEPRAVPDDAIAALGALAERFRLAPGARVTLVQGCGDVFTGLGEKLGGAYGRVEGAPWTAAVVAPEGAEVEAGYVGEAFVLEATRLGLGTCWVAGMFDRDTADRLAELAPGERVVAVTPVGYPLERKALVERMMSAAVRSAARRQVEDIAPSLVRNPGVAARSAQRPVLPGEVGDAATRTGSLGAPGAVWPLWAVSAVEAARLAPSGANRQPWRFRLDARGLVLATSTDAYWTAPIDCGIAMLHAELGALHEGVCGDWVRLPAPEVARFEPDGS
jgi:nitroreductase